LLGRSLRAIYDGAERLVVAAAFRIPAEMLARDAHARGLAVERVQRRDVLQ